MCIYVYKNVSFIIMKCKLYMIFVLIYSVKYY